MNFSRFYDYFSIKCIYFDTLENKDKDWTLNLDKNIQIIVFDRFNI